MLQSADKATWIKVSSGTSGPNTSLRDNTHASRLDESVVRGIDSSSSSSASSALLSLRLAVRSSSSLKCSASSWLLLPLPEPLNGNLIPPKSSLCPSTCPSSVPPRIPSLIQEPKLL